LIKSLVIHIGDPKCGSTSIQQALLEEACTAPGVSLAAYRPMAGGKLANVLDLSRGEEKLAEAYGNLASWTAQQDADVGFVSSETFSGVAPENLMHALQTYLPDLVPHTSFIAYVRPHAARFVSTYSQRLKTGTFNKPMHRFLAYQERQPALYYYPRFLSWQSVFGEALTLRPFVPDLLRNKDVVSDFFYTALPGHRLALSEPKRMNEALFTAELAGLRLLQSVLTARSVPRPLRQSIGGAFGRHLQGLPGRTGEKPTIDRKLAKNLIRVYKDDACKLDQTFFDAPVMSQSLDVALEDAPDTRSSCRAQSHFSSKTLKTLEGIFGEMADLLLQKPRAWQQTNRLTMRKVTSSETRILHSSAEQCVNQIWLLLDLAAQILANRKAPKAKG
jgi:hypothetical protein